MLAAKEGCLRVPSQLLQPLCSRNGFHWLLSALHLYNVGSFHGHENPSRFHAAKTLSLRTSPRPSLPAWGTAVADGRLLFAPVNGCLRPLHCLWLWFRLLHWLWLGLLLWLWLGLRLRFRLWLCLYLYSRFRLRVRVHLRVRYYLSLNYFRLYLLLWLWIPLWLGLRIRLCRIRL